MDIPTYPVICPGCGTRIVPDFLCCHRKENVIFSKCNVTGCDEFFLLRLWGDKYEILRNRPLSKEVFSEIITSVSSSFGRIYNESYAAEQMALMEVCGVGYRKSLEFLIKDYVIQNKDEATADIIKKMPLSKCIDDYVMDLKIKELAKRAVWIGNDEAHYVRKWEEKDVQDLKGLIHLTILWIVKEKETERLLAEMSVGRK